MTHVWNDYRGSSKFELKETGPFHKEDFPKLAIEKKPDHPKEILEWCEDHKSEILGIHSSEVYTPIFTKDCRDCKRYYKDCMFAKGTHNDHAMKLICSWCQTARKALKDRYEDFVIHHHIHCGTDKKLCGPIGFPYFLRKPLAQASPSTDNIETWTYRVDFKKKQSTQRARKDAAREAAKAAEALKNERLQDGYYDHDS